MNASGANENSNVFESMYTYKEKYNQHKEQLNLEINQSIIRDSTIIHTNTITDNIFNNLKESAFKRIFKILDSDEDGVISIFYNNLNGLPKSITKIVNPIFEEMKKNFDTLVESEFLKAINYLFDVLIFVKLVTSL